MSLILHSYKFNWNHFEEITKNEKINPILKAMKYDIVTLLYNSKNGIKMFFLDNNNELKSIDYKIDKSQIKKLDDLLVFDKFKNENTNFLELSSKYLKKLDTNQTTDLRHNMILPILYKYYNIKNPTLVNETLVWETPLKNRDKEILSLYKNKEVSNEEKLNLLKKLLNEDFPEDSLENDFNDL